MSYGRFLDYVEAGRVTAVDIYDGGRNAVIEAVDPDLDNRVQRLRVDLPGLAPELVNTLKEEGDQLRHPPPTDSTSGPWPVGQSAVPAAVDRIIDLPGPSQQRHARRPGQAMQFGKSKARFMMEAETGVMFDDVAGVAEAKQELRKW
jgi:cell division protease FtsH